MPNNRRGWPSNAHSSESDRAQGVKTKEPCEPPSSAAPRWLCLPLREKHDISGGNDLTMKSVLLLLAVAAAVVDARKSAPQQRQAIQASPSGLPAAGRPIVRGARKLPPMAMILPTDNFPLMVVEEGAVNFLSLYGGVLTLRILLSWFPQAQSVALLRPIFTVSDVYLNLFRGVIPSIAGLDIRCVCTALPTALGNAPCTVRAVHQAGHQALVFFCTRLL